MEQLFGSASVLSVLVSFAALAGFFYSRQKVIQEREKAAKEQGAQEQTIVNLKEDLDHAWDKIHEIDRDQNKIFTMLGKIETKLEAIDNHLGGIDAKLQARV